MPKDQSNKHFATTASLQLPPPFAINKMVTTNEQQKALPLAKPDML